LTLQEAVQVFDRTIPVDSAWIVEGGERVGVPYCCNIPVAQNSQDGVARLYCDRCRREIRQVSQQWIVHNWGDRGIKLPSMNVDGPAARREEAEIERHIREAVDLAMAQERARIQRAHDILHFLGTDQAPALFDEDGAIAAHAAHDVLAWVLGFPCGQAFESNLAAAVEMMGMLGYMEVDVGQPINHEEARKRGLV
jgi:hypothetical protein